MSQGPLLLLSFRCVAVRSSSRNSTEQFLSKSLIILFLLQLLISCGEKKSTAENNPEPVKGSSTAFYPLHDFFLIQIHKVDSAAQKIMFLQEANNRKDSLAINKKQFTQLVQPFLQNEINDKALNKSYKQSVFQDETTGSYIFNYSATDKSLPVQSIDVLVDTSTQQVKRVFITSEKTSGDTVITQKSGWKTDESFFINTLKQIQGKETVTQIFVLWYYKN